MVCKVFVSAYLFLLGYCDFSHWFESAELGPVHLFKSLLRYNLLTALFCITLDRSYQFYEISSLLSFWHLMIYLLFIIPPVVTSRHVHGLLFSTFICSKSYGTELIFIDHPVRYFILCAKLIVAFVLVAVFYLSQVSGRDHNRIYFDIIISVILPRNITRSTLALAAH
jgi:hypothetical protein